VILNQLFNNGHNSIKHDRTKHIEIDRHYIKEKLESGLITYWMIS